MGKRLGVVGDIAQETIIFSHEGMDLLKKERCIECHQREKESGVSQFSDIIARERGESHTSASVIDVLLLNSSSLITGEQVTRLFPARHLY